MHLVQRALRALSTLEDRLRPRCLADRVAYIFLGLSLLFLGFTLECRKSRASAYAIIHRIDDAAPDSNGNAIESAALSKQH